MMNLQAKLSPRETQVAELIAWGAAKKEVAEHLCISTRTVENTARSIYEKLNISKATELSVYWFCTRHGISMVLSPLKKVAMAVIMLFVFLPYSMHGDIYRIFRSRTLPHVAAAAKRSENETLYLIP